MIINRILCFYSLLIIPSFPGLAQDDELYELTLEELQNVKMYETNKILADSVITFSGRYQNVGLILPYSKYSRYASAIEKAARLAQEEINKSGLGKGFNLIIADDAGDNKMAVEVTQKLINTYKVKKLIGPTSSSRVLAVANQVSIGANTTLFTPSATAVEVTHLKDNNSVFRLTASDAFQGKAVARYLNENQKFKKVGVLYIGNLYGKGLLKSFKENFDQTNIVSEVSYSPLVDYSEIDFSEKLKELFKSNPSVVYLISTEDEASIISKKIIESGLHDKNGKTIFIGCEAMNGNDFLNDAPAAFLENYYTVSASRNIASSFKKIYFERYKSECTLDAAAVYDIVYLYAFLNILASKNISVDLKKITEGNTIIKAGEFIKAFNILSAGQSIKYEGASGNIAFDEFGDLKNLNFDILKATNRKYQILFSYNFN